MNDAPLRIAYIVHDVNDAAVERRIRMMHAAGAKVQLMGFRRDERLPDRVADAPVCDLGITGDGRLVQRAWAVIAILIRPGQLLEACNGCDIIVARNLEALALGARVSRQRQKLRLVYECLDIHRMLLGHSLPARAVQSIERALLRKIDLLLVSSPAFVREHFAARMPSATPVLLVENKVLAIAGQRVPASDPPPQPWTIGWFGNLRCHRTFDLLRDVAARGAGRVKILIAGRPSPAVFEDFSREVEQAEHCAYIGPYASDDLPQLYAQCHFAWAIDYFEEGLNSSWLLPNRLYEAASAHVVPIALGTVETGRWLTTHRAGLLLGDVDPAGQLSGVLERLSTDDYSALRRSVAAIPETNLFTDLAECQAMMTAITGT